MVNTLEEIKEVIIFPTTTVEVLNGFISRNVPISKSDTLIAFTTSEFEYPKDGGTTYTWNLTKSDNKIHINIGKFK